MKNINSNTTEAKSNDMQASSSTKNSLSSKRKLEMDPSEASSSKKCDIKKSNKCDLSKYSAHDFEDADDSDLIGVVSEVEEKVAETLVDENLLQTIEIDGGENLESLKELKSEKPSQSGFNVRPSTTRLINELKEYTEGNRTSIDGENEKSEQDMSCNSKDFDNSQEDESDLESLISDDDEKVIKTLVADKPLEKIEIEGISQEDWKLLERVSSKNSQTGLNIGPSTSSNRLMKELKEMYRSQKYKENAYQIELVNDSLYEFNIKLNKIDTDSGLWKDLESLEYNGGKNHVLLNFHFSEQFPFEPPFVRIVYPIIHGGNVTMGGAICMELLTKQGWSCLYNIESVILQVAATISKGRAPLNVNLDTNIEVYTLSRAQRSFKLVSDQHEILGWSKTPLKN
jgi:ubiquitin-protein ligase